MMQPPDDDENTGSSRDTTQPDTSLSSSILEQENPRDCIPADESPQEAIVNSGDNLTACLQVVGAFFLMFNSWGIANTFGCFQAFYEIDFLKHESPSSISWIGSTQATVMLFVGGICTGQIYDSGNMHEMILVGSFLIVFGMMMTSLCNEYWQVVLAQGITIGLGCGCLLLPSVAVMPQYFTHRRAFATGLGACGSSLGGVIYPIVFTQLQPLIGFGWATRVMAFIMLSTLLIPITVMRAKSFPAIKRPFIDLKVLRDLPWVLFSIGEFFGFMGMYVPFYYVSSYALSTGIVDKHLSFYLLTILNTASIFGRIVPNFYADLIGPLNMILPCTLVCGIIALCWTSISSAGNIIVFCIFYGFFSGTFVSITAPALVKLSPDLTLVGTHMGMSFSFSAVGLLIGNPVAGVLLDRYGWTGPAVFCGIANITAAFFVVAARITKTGWKFMVKL